MFQYIGFAEIINIFVLPFIGLALNLIWLFSKKKKKS